MSAESNVISLEEHAAFAHAGRANPSALIDSCESIALTYLVPLLKRMLDAADDNLFELADKAENNTIQTAYFDAMREVRLKRQSLETRFAEQLAAAFGRFWDSGSGSHASASLEPFSLENLSLVDETHLEESLAVDGMVEKAKSRQMQELYGIEQRLAHIAGGRTLDDEHNPLAPRAIAEAFREAAQTLDTDLKVVLILYKLFDKHVLAHVGALYQEVNGLFIDAGILPKLKSRLGQREERSAARPAPPTLAAEASVLPTAQESGGAEEGDLLTALKQLLMQERQDAAFSLGLVSDAPSGEVMGALSGLQLQALSLPASGGVSLLDGNEIRQAIIAQAPGGAALGQVDSTIIDVVCMLFDFILEDKNLPDGAKALIGRLQIPYLKVALVDKEFLSRKGHPARRLLNELAHAGLGLDEAQSREGLLAKMEQIVGRVLHDFEEDVGLFDTLNAELAAFLEEERQREAAALEETLRGYEAREAEKRAEADIHRTLRGRIAALELPPEVAEWLRVDWAEVLLQTHRREGGEGEQWQRHLQFIDDLAWSLTPKRDPAEKRELAARIPRLLMALRQGMTEAALSAKRIDRAIHSLEPFHLASFDAPPPTRKPASSPAEAGESAAAAGDDLSQLVSAMEENMAALNALEAIFDEEEESDAPATTAPQASEMLDFGDDDGMEEIVLGGRRERDTGPDDEHLDTARGLELGVWVQFTQENGRTRRGKLAWKSELLGEYTFVSWRHQVIAEKTLHGLAADFRRGSAQVVKDAPVLDRAMDAVLSGLKHRLERTPAAD